MRTRHFGAIEGVPVGAIFWDRVDLSRAGVHRPPQDGICGSNDGEGAESVVLSDGYVDDDFRGDIVMYTGQGGRHPETKRQVTDQPWNRYNASLARSSLTGRPVRVSRLTTGVRDRQYRYEGLYRVATYWKDRGQDGHFVWQYRLERLSPEEAASWGETWKHGRGHDAVVRGQTVPMWLLASLPSDLFRASQVQGEEIDMLREEDAPWGNAQAAPRREEVVQRIVRDTAVMSSVKRLHAFVCQICRTRLDTPAGPYAEAAHVRPLGTPHDGPDVLENLVCLCPNCHVRMDRGAVSIADDGRLLGDEGVLGTAPGHCLDKQHLAYHRTHIFNPWPRGEAG